MKNKLIFIISMVIFGTIGIFRKFIPLDSAVISFSRGVIGTLFLIVFLLVKKDKPNIKELKSYIVLLIISGCLIGINWLFLFESYKYTSVATSTLCYYMAPIFVMIASTFVFKEKLKAINIICMLIAFVGMIFVSSVLEIGFDDKNALLGVLYGLAAAVLYATVVLLNKKIKVEIGIKDLDSNSETIWSNMGIIHTGISYVLYFGSITKVKTQFISIFSYIDPVIAIILSAIILKDSMTFLGVVGAILILGVSLFMEIFDMKQKHQE